MRSTKIGTAVKNFFYEFKTFAVKGNMVDIAVGMIVGGAFTALINSIITNIVTPLIGMLIGVDFSTWYIELPRLYGNAPPGHLNIGLLLNSIISFLVITFVVFLFVKTLNKFRKKKEEQEADADAPEPSNDEVLLAEIRDILREMKDSEPEIPDDEKD